MRITSSLAFSERGGHNGAGSVSSPVTLQWKNKHYRTRWSTFRMPYTYSYTQFEAIPNAVSRTEHPIRDLHSDIHPRFLSSLRRAGTPTRRHTPLPCSPFSALGQRCCSPHAPLGAAMTVPSRTCSCHPEEEGGVSVVSLRSPWLSHTPFGHPIMFRRRALKTHASLKKHKGKPPTSRRCKSSIHARAVSLTRAGGSSRGMQDCRVRFHSPPILPQILRAVLLPCFLFQG